MMADMRLLMLAIIHQLQSGKSKLKQLQQARTAKYHECSGMLRAADSFGIPTTVPSRLAYFRKSTTVVECRQPSSRTVWEHSELQRVWIKDLKLCNTSYCNTSTT